MRRKVAFADLICANGLAGRRLAQQRVEGADESPIGGEVHVENALEQIGIEMAERAERAQYAGIAYQDIEPAEALVKRRRHMVELAEIGEVERHQGRGAAVAADRVVGLFKAADRAGDQDQMRAFGGEATRDRGADAARGAGHEGDAPRQPTGGFRAHVPVNSAISESAVATLP